MHGWRRMYLYKCMHMSYIYNPMLASHIQVRTGLVLVQACIHNTDDLSPSIQIT